MTPSPGMLVVIGIGDDGPAGLAPEANAHLAAAQVLAGGKRHLDFFPDWHGERIVIDADLERLVGRLRACARDRKIVVLASGDPLFYGIGRVLLEAFPKEELLFLPHLSSVQLAFARIKETWNDARVVSLHGRPLETLGAALQEGAAKIAVLTDTANDPSAIAAFLRETGHAEGYDLWVCENLGGPDERVRRFTPRDLKGESFTPLNVVVLVQAAITPLSPPGSTVGDGDGGEGRTSQTPLAPPGSTAGDGDGGEGRTRGGDVIVPPLLGIPDQAFLPASARHGLVTQREIRLISLCYLELRPGDVLWDIGAGSGSVGIEAARLEPRLQVFAVERAPSALRQLEDNVKFMAASSVRVIAGEAPEALARLPNPEAVFIGGSGGKLREIIAAVVARLKPDGRVVLNCITIENFTRGWEALREHGLEPEATSIQLARSRPLGGLHCLEAEKVTFIVRGRKLVRDEKG